MTGGLRKATIGYLYSKQMAMFGEREVIGFGSNDFMVAVIDRDLANSIVAERHYSKRFVGSSRIHLGVSIDGELVGVLQFGVAMNPASMGRILQDCGLYEYLELNRMWLDDKAPRNSESRAISYAIKYIRKAEPKILFIQSFADERCGLNGTVYQAANFLYCGEHLGKFWELDGEFYHDSILTDSKKMDTPRGRHLRANAARAVLHRLRQFRYIYMMQPRFRSRLLLPVKPYPKPIATRPADEPVPAGASLVQPEGVAP
jgi:adenine modification enzyme